MSELWHRFDDVLVCPVDGGVRVEVCHQTFRVIRSTPTGVQLEVGLGRRFVKNDSRRQFASATIQQAHEKFKLRKACQLRILKTRIRYIEEALRVAESHPDLNT